MTSEAARTKTTIFNIESYPCMPKAASHSIQGMAGHSGQTRKQIPLCFISIDRIAICKMLKGKKTKVVGMFKIMN